MTSHETALSRVGARSRRRPAPRVSGQLAEQAVEVHLVAQGWQPLARNHVVAGGEVDLIMRHGETLVFVEVRLRAAGTTVALESLGAAKLRRVVRAAALYLASSPLGDVPIRFDVVAVQPCPGGEYRFEHLPAAFDAGEFV